MRLAYLSIALLYSAQLSARVDTLWVFSDTMQKSIGSTVILPDNYEESEWYYPVVYLLHGAGGDYGNWLRRVPELDSLASAYSFIFVCPDGEKTSWYLDSPIDSTMKYESYIIDELVPTVDRVYRTQPHINNRAITGLSMGGHGAMYLSLRNPEVFSIAGSMSGGVDLRPFPGNWEIPLRLGNHSEHYSNWEENSVVYIAESESESRKTGSWRFIVDCGTEDFFLEANRSLSKVLKEKHYNYIYSERKGAHNWPYWRESIIEHLDFFKQTFFDLVDD